MNDMFTEFRQLLFKSAGEDWKAAPCFGIEVLVVEMERRRVALAFPLVAAPEFEEPLNPQAQLLRLKIGRSFSTGL